MPAKGVDAFFEKVEQDKSLQAKLTALHKNIVKESKKTSAAEIVKIAANGFQFTVKEWNEKRKVRAKKASKGELKAATVALWCENQTYDECRTNFTCIRTNWY